MSHVKSAPTLTIVYPIVVIHLTLSWNIKLFNHLPAIVAGWVEPCTESQAWCPHTSDTRYTRMYYA